jgi:hypothetical protein
MKTNLGNYIRVVCLADRRGVLRPSHHLQCLEAAAGE